jgi:membrane-bound lytic murein transglycosylase D
MFFAALLTSGAFVLPAIAASTAADRPPDVATVPAASAASTATTSPAATDTDLWQRIRKGFVLDALDSPLVAEQEAWYASRPDYIQRFVDRGSRYLFHVVEEVEKRGMPTEIALLPVIESAFNPQAYSRAKAAGMWQFIPSTGKSFGLKQDWQADHRRDVLLSTSAAMDYLQKLHAMFDSWELALAAYNCGEGCVGRAIQKNRKKGLPTDFSSLPLPNETRYYVPKLLAIKNIVLAPGDYGIDLVPVQNRPYFEKVAAPDRMDVKLAARLAQMSEEEFAALNPASHRPVAATSTGAFLVPIEKADVFRDNLALYRELQGPLVSWRMVYAKRGESVDAVAARHGMTAAYLRATGGPFKEKKGKLTQNVSFMAPNAKDARQIDATLQKNIALKAEKTEQTVGAHPAGLDAPPPVRAEAAASASAAAKDASAVRPDVIEVTVHRVVRGETLFSLARLYGTSVEDIRDRNRLETANLREGQQLQIVGGTMPNAGMVAAHVASLPVSTTNKAVARTAASGRHAGGATHLIRSGETLYGIALKYGVTLADLLRWNRLSPRAVIQPGSRLRLGA